jgi:D-arabinose 1-dehydrogenase-like Zn-dependent alcohol dehydrogenase
LQCTGVTTFDALRKPVARPGDLVAIQGFGGLGHLAVQFARHMGFRTAAIARDPAKRDLALSLGAHHYVDSIEDALNFSLLQDVRALIEMMPFERAPEAYARMLANEARFRMVIEMALVS